MLFDEPLAADDWQLLIRGSATGEDIDPCVCVAVAFYWNQRFDVDVTAIQNEMVLRKSFHLELWRAGQKAHSELVALDCAGDGPFMADVIVDLREQTLISGSVADSEIIAADLPVLVFHMTDADTPTPLPKHVTRTDCEGRFSLFSTRDRDLALVISPPRGWAPFSTTIRSCKLRTFDIGVVELSQGLKISGMVVKEPSSSTPSGVQAILDSSAYARCVLLENIPIRGISAPIAWCRGRAVLLRSFAWSDLQGAFSISGLDSFSYTIQPIDDFEDQTVRYHEGTQRAFSEAVFAPASSVLLNLRTATLSITLTSRSDPGSEILKRTLDGVNRWHMSLRDQEGRTTSAISWVQDEMRPPGYEVNVREFLVVPGMKYILTIESSGYETIKQEVIAYWPGERRQYNVEMIVTAP